MQMQDAICGSLYHWILSVILSFTRGRFLHGPNLFLHGIPCTTVRGITLLVQARDAKQPVRARPCALRSRNRPCAWRVHHRGMHASRGLRAPSIYERIYANEAKGLLRNATTLCAPIAVPIVQSLVSRRYMYTLSWAVCCWRHLTWRKEACE